MKAAFSKKLLSSTKILMPGLMSVAPVAPVLMIALIMASSTVLSGCKAKHVARGKLRSSSFTAPFAATLSASEDGWQVDLLQNGAPSTEYSVSSVSYISSTAGAVPANLEGTVTSGTVTFGANVNYTFQFNATKSGTKVTALCETTYPAPLRYTVDAAYVQCNADLSRAAENTPGNTPRDDNGSPSTNTTSTELEADRTIGFAIQQKKVTVTDALTSLIRDLGYNFSQVTISRWNSLGARVGQIVENYAGDGIAATEEVTNAVSGGVQVADSLRVAEALIQAYSKPSAPNTGNAPGFIAPTAPEDPATPESPAQPQEAVARCVCDREQCDFSVWAGGWSCGQIGGTIPVPDRDGDNSCAAWSNYAAKVPLDGRPINQSYSYYHPVNCRLVNN